MPLLGESNLEDGPLGRESNVKHWLEYLRVIVLIHAVSLCTGFELSMFYPYLTGPKYKTLTPPHF